MSRLPALYIPHGGGPCFFMAWDPPDTWSRMADYLRGVSADIGQRPKAILMISAHWEAAQITIQTNPAPPLLFDYYGFPDATYRLEYPAPGSSALVARIAALLRQEDIPFREDGKRGFDHGTFIPLKLIFPEADIPIVQVSLRADLDPAAHIALGWALMPLRDEGILIIGSGMSYHNMERLMANMRGSNTASPQSTQFDDWLAKTLTDQTPEDRASGLVEWQSAPAALDAHPRAEHLLPLHVVVGAAGPDPGRRMLQDTVMGAAVSAFQFG
ncbi:MAG: DODA-type extradiol aromatic ring-opening family dioxygenase [Alphaproteobacteria bacterium]